jgi:hypothetical protein
MTEPPGRICLKMPTFKIEIENHEPIIVEAVSETEAIEAAKTIVGSSEIQGDISLV